MFPATQPSHQFSHESEQMDPKSSNDRAQIQAMLRSFILAETWPETRTVLQREYALLTAPIADDVLAEWIEERRPRDDPGAAQAVQMLILHRNLLTRCRVVGVAQAWSEFEIEQQLDVDNVLTTQLQAWVLTPTYREARRMLLQHPEFLEPRALTFLDRFIAAAKQIHEDELQELNTLTDSAQVRTAPENEVIDPDERIQALRQRVHIGAKSMQVLQDHKQLLEDVNARGGSPQAIEDAIINLDGGFTLDLPDWLEAYEREDAPQRELRDDATVAQRLDRWSDAMDRIDASGELRAEIRAEVAVRLFSALFAVRHGGRLLALEEAIALLEWTLKVYDRDRYPIQWAKSLLNLGVLHTERLAGSIRQHQETALSCYLQAMEVFTLESFPVHYASVQNNLGDVYQDRLEGSREVNLEQAIDCYQRALEYHTFEAAPGDYAMTQVNLGIACLHRMRGIRRENLEAALTCFSEALRVYTPDAYPTRYATALLNLGNASLARQEGVHSENVERAIACYQSALKIYTRDGFPHDFALLQNNLGNAFLDRKVGDRRHNVASALACYRDALTIRTLETSPSDYRDTSLNIANWALGACATLALEQNDEALYTQALGIADGAFRDARQAQTELVWSEANPHDVAVARGVAYAVRELYIHHAWCLLKRGALRDAVVALEAGRAQAQAAVQAIAAEPLEGVCIEHAEAFVRVRQVLNAARSDGDPTTILAAHEEFRALRQAIRAHCQPNFLPGEPAYTEITHAAAKNQSLVYLAATRWGGCALVVSPDSNEPRVIDLPQLTSNVVDHWLERTDERGFFVGGYAYTLAKRAREQILRWVMYHAYDDDDERSHRMATRIVDLPHAIAPEFASLGRAFDKLILTWQAEITLLKSGTPKDQERAQTLQTWLAFPLSDGLANSACASALASDLNVFLHMEELDLVLEQLAHHCVGELRRGLDSLGLHATDQEIALIPCGKLGLLPIHAARVTGSSTGALVPFQETCTLSYQASAASLRSARASLGQLPITPGPILAIGNPRPTRETDLPWARIEAECLGWVAKQANRIMTEAIIDEEATLSRVLAELEQVRDKQIGAWVTIASHGHADPHDPENSFLLLAGNERLSLARIQRGSLLAGVREFNAEGCVTGLVDQQHAPDELGSFASGILQAGAASALATQWAVSDRATFLLALKRTQYILEDPSLSPARALRLATHWLRTATWQDLEKLSRAASEGFSHQPDRNDELGDTLRGVQDGDNVIEDVVRDVSEETAREYKWTLAEGFDLLGQQARIQLTLEQDRPYSHPFFWASSVVYGA